MKFGISSKQLVRLHQAIIGTCKEMFSDINCGENVTESGPQMDAQVENQHEQQNSNQLLAPNTTQDAKSRPFDVIIFGASGSVGKFVVEEMALVVNKYYSSGSKFQQQQTIVTSSLGLKELRDPTQFAQNRRSSVPRSLNDIKWAVAGRSAMRLSETLCQAELSTGIKGLSNNVPVILADLDHHRSLLEMCLKASLVINCAGPYSMDGETLIKACIGTKTNYLDLSFETNFIERINRMYSSRAKAAQIFIINGCGFQSMAVEMGLNFLKQVTDGQIERVKILLSLSNTKAIVRPSSGRSGEIPVEQNGIITRGMWNSWLVEKAQEISVDERVSEPQVRSRSPVPSTSRATIESIDEEDEERSDNRKPLLRRDTQTMVKDMVEFQNRNSIAWFEMLSASGDEAGKGYCLPTNSFTSEESQLIRGEMANYEHRKPDMDSKEGWRPIRCKSFLSLKSFSEVLILLIWLLLFNVFVKFYPFRRVMKTFPVISSLGNVTSVRKKLDRDNLSHIKYCQTFVAYGIPGDDSGDPLEQREEHLKRKQEELLVARVVGPEPNHVATSTFVVQAALTLISEQDHLPKGGGVITPGAAFSETNIIYQLRRRNIKFEVLKKA